MKFPKKAFLKIINPLIYGVIGFGCAELFIMFYNGVILKEKPFQPRDLFFAIIPGIFYIVSVIRNHGKQVNDHDQADQKTVYKNTAIYIIIVLVIIVLVVWIGRIVTL
ncbi:hypothetical protein JOD45_001208 [Scopulibacillus daqui]|uniref:Uncharacterized protein n=1 Tax=Scopulibacillus daqui TaxID=1469162 RepID=A0ABS2PY82_9BACL|nr:hypothetical protein [Scopulibacillus daqui]MBM7644999.1 hypothetical protein [Scopulibacillus daqui]